MGRSRLRIAIPIHRYNRQGGIERHTWEMVERWRREHEVHIFAAEFAPTDQDVVLHKVPALKNRFLATPSFVIANTLMLRKHDFDVVWNNGCGATFSRGVITAASLHTAWAREAKKAGLKRFFLNPLHYWTFAVEGFNYRGKRYKKVIAISELIKRYVMELCGVPAKDIDVIHHGVNLKEFDPAMRAVHREAVRKDIGAADDDIVVIFVGKEFRRKGLQYVFEAMRALNDRRVKLLVIGDGEIAQFKGMAQKAGIADRVVFAGHSSNVAPYYAASDMFVFPSTFDAFGMVVLEAMASAVPPVVSSSTGASELIDHMNDGIVLNDYKDVEGLKNAIKLLADDPSLRERLGRGARKKAEAHSWDEVAEKTIRIFRGASGL